MKNEFCNPRVLLILHSFYRFPLHTHKHIWKYLFYKAIQNQRAILSIIHVFEKDDLKLCPPMSCQPLKKIAHLGAAK